ncbi:MAG: LysE family translocator [Alphaproteobacteria bacterium]|nr:LysE family translocator [Alphaproteobacteria bacterium]
MMTLELYLAFVVATAILMLIPGPNVAVIAAHSIGHGTRYGLLTVAGSCSAMVIQLTLTVLGMAAVLAAASEWFEWLRWAGIAYLIFLGIRYWRMAPPDANGTERAAVSPDHIFWRGFWVSAANPKTLMFYGAFFPQFIAPGGNVSGQLIVLAVTFLAVAAVLDSAWAVFAGSAQRLLADRARLRGRLTGTFLIGAALGLALARKS